MKAAPESRFRSPPIPGTEWIIPITTSEDLALEGVRQRNCVAAYRGDVFWGTMLIYRVLWPQRATLSLRRDTRGFWQIDELLLKANRRVSHATHRAVEDWLEHHREIIQRQTERPVPAVVQVARPAPWVFPATFCLSPQ